MLFFIFVEKQHRIAMPKMASNMGTKAPLLWLFIPPVQHSGLIMEKTLSHKGFSNGLIIKAFFRLNCPCGRQGGEGNACVHCFCIDRAAVMKEEPGIGY